MGNTSCRILFKYLVAYGVFNWLDRRGILFSIIILNYKYFVFSIRTDSNDII